MLLLYLSPSLTTFYPGFSIFETLAHSYVLLFVKEMNIIFSHMLETIVSIFILFVADWRCQLCKRGKAVKRLTARRGHTALPVTINLNWLLWRLALEKCGMLVVHCLGIFRKFKSWKVHCALMARKYIIQTLFTNRVQIYACRIR